MDFIWLSLKWSLQHCQYRNCFHMIVFMGTLIDNFMNNSNQLNPMRQKMNRWVQYITVAVWKEHYCSNTWCNYIKMGLSRKKYSITQLYKMVHTSLRYFHCSWVAPSPEVWFILTSNANTACAQSLQTAHKQCFSLLILSVVRMQFRYFTKASALNVFNNNNCRASP